MRLYFGGVRGAERTETGPSFPAISKVGFVVMLVGFLFDLVEHTVIGHDRELVVAGFPASEHAAHFVVIVGMVLVIAGVIATGVRLSAPRKQSREEDANAVR